jgi:hypothetical protein
MASDAQNDPSSTGSAVVILSKVVMVGRPRVFARDNRRRPAARLRGTPATAPTMAAMSSNTGWLSGTELAGAARSVAQEGHTIQRHDYGFRHRVQHGDVATSFSAVTGMTLTASTFALVSEMYTDVSYLNFFSVMKNPVIYARSIS